MNVVSKRNRAPDLLKPQLHKTDIALLNALHIDDCRAEFRALREDFEADYNRAHFKWDDDVKNIDYGPLRNEFYEFLNRSPFGEFSGCLPYKPFDLAGLPKLQN
ncbi:MAG: hypothetical protein NVSMB64_31650 [Candidatus Velthaea sp.]